MTASPGVSLHETDVRADSGTRMRKYVNILWMISYCCWTFAAENSVSELRIQHWERCGDLFDVNQVQICMTISGDVNEKTITRFNHKIVPTAQIHKEKHFWRVTLTRTAMTSGPLWLEQNDRKSNAVWVSRGDSHVLAAREGEVVKNADGIETYLNLVSLIIEERYDGLRESQALAKKYNATLVGAIPPLNLYQLRLPAANLIERDALILRLGSEVQVDAVVIEETSAEKSLEGDGVEEKLPEQNHHERTANRFLDAVDFYRRRGVKNNQPVKIGIIERNIDFDSPDFRDYLGGCHGDPPRTCIYSRDGDSPDSHGSTVVGVFAAAWNNGGNDGFLRGLETSASRFDIIVDRNSDAGVTANIAASVNLVEDGVKLLNWSWGFHRIGTKNLANEMLDSAVRSGVAMSGYEELLEEFFLWLRHKHPDVIVVNSAGNGSAFSGQDEYRLPSSLVTEQLLVIAGHELNKSGDELSKSTKAAVTDPSFAIRRNSSNLDARVDISAAACSQGSVAKIEDKAKMHCGTSYAAPLVAATIAAMQSINPALTPEQIRLLLRRSAMAIGPESDFEAPEADDLTAPILPSERDQQLNHREIGRSARLDMYKALDLAAQSVESAR